MLRMRRWQWLVALILGSALMGCGAGGGAGAGSGEMGDLSDDDGAVGGISEVPNPTKEMASASGAPLDQLQRGHVVYMLQCAQCHSYMRPEDFFDDEWEDTLPKMIGHTGLSDGDEKAVLAYVKAVGTMQ